MKDNIYSEDGRSLRYHVSTLYITGMYETCVFREFGLKGSAVLNREYSPDKARTFHSAAVQALKFSEGVIR